MREGFIDYDNIDLLSITLGNYKAASNVSTMVERFGNEVLRLCEQHGLRGEALNYYVARFGNSPVCAAQMLVLYDNLPRKLKSRINGLITLSIEDAEVDK